jgi:tetratricopeptide (TPR) repeat protein
VAFFAAGREFERVETRLIARLGQTLRLQGDLYHTGKHYADQGLWAMAVPYWQRAAANDPTRVFYQQRLGEAYARLGFYERSLNVLEGAARATFDPEAKAEIERMMEEVKQRMRNG